MARFDVATKFGQGRENLCHDREFSVATKLTNTGSPVAMTKLSAQRPVRTNRAVQ